MTINERFAAAKAAGRPSADHRDRPWQVRLPRYTLHAITDGERLADDTSLDGRTTYTWETKTVKPSKYSDVVRVLRRLRRRPAKVKGKAAVKAAKRARQRARKVAT